MLAFECTTSRGTMHTSTRIVSGWNHSSQRSLVWSFLSFLHSPTSLKGRPWCGVPKAALKRPAELGGHFPSFNVPPRYGQTHTSLDSRINLLILISYCSIRCQWKQCFLGSSSPNRRRPYNIESPNLHNNSISANTLRMMFQILRTQYIAGSNS
jgi:hypothetical protein